MQKGIPFSSLNVIIIGTTVSYGVSASEGNLCLARRLSGDARWVRAGQSHLRSKLISGGGCNKNVMVYIFCKKITRGGLSIPD